MLDAPAAPREAKSQPRENILWLRALYATLLRNMGPSGWWPADSKFEIMVGAVLTQNTAWANVDRSLTALKRACALDPRAILAMNPARLQKLIRSSGFYVNKARSVRTLCRWYGDRCGFRPAGAAGIPDGRLRDELLGIFGVGGETADDLLLYVFDRPTFVADTYARRLLTFLGVTVPTGYERLRALMMPQVRAAGFTVTELQELHGLIDNYGKHFRTPATMQGSFLGVRGSAQRIGSPNQPR